jgi:hypothetical protein
MMKRKIKDGILLYEKNSTKISKETNGILYCEFIHTDLKTPFVSVDVLEITTALMKIKEYREDKSIWNIKIKNKWNTSAEKALYWLSGGDKEWLINKNYIFSWSEVYHIFLNEYGEVVNNILEKSQTLGELKNNFEKYISLQKIYEFSIDNNLIKV